MMNFEKQETFASLNCLLELQEAVMFAVFLSMITFFIMTGKVNIFE